MSLTQSLLLHVPSWLLCILLVAVYVLLAIAGQIVARRYYPHHICKLHNDISGFIFSLAGVLYAVLLAFVAVISWQAFDKSQDAVLDEANAVVMLYKQSAHYPAEFGIKARHELVAYASAVVGEEWKVMASGGQDERAEQSISRLRALYLGAQPENVMQERLYSDSLDKLDRAEEARMSRIQDARQGIHPILNFVLFLGGVITVAYTMLLSTENIKPQLVLTSMLSTLIGLTLFTIIVMDYPFTGDFSIQPEALADFLSTLSTKH